MKKGLASFEFLMTLGIILLITTVLISDAVAESKKTFVLSSTKYSLTSRLGVKSSESPGCSNPRIDSYEVINNNTLMLNVSPDQCTVNSSNLADEVEKEICGVNPNHDGRIKCGGDLYEVQIN